jgi:hypothetical protein
MKKYFASFAAGVLGLLIAGMIYGATYTMFSPGGALSGTWNSQNVNLSAGSSFITGTTPAGNGGTGQTAATDDAVLVANGTIFQPKVIPDCQDTAASGNHLNYTQSSNTITCGTSLLETTGTFTATFTSGYTVNQTQNYTWRMIGNLVYLSATNSMTGTSNTADLSTAVAALPAAITPSVSIIGAMDLKGVDNGANKGLCLSLNSAGVMAYGIADLTTGSCGTGLWTASGTKTVNSATNVKHFLIYSKTVN